LVSLKTILTLLIVFLSATSLAQAQPRQVLTTEERAYLEQLGPITVAPDPDWKPFEHVDAEGRFTGIAADLLDLIAERFDIEFTYVIPANWDEAIALSQSGQVLILPFLNQTPAREEWLTFTDPLFVDPNIFITREEHPFISDARSLSDKVMALPSGTSIEERVRRDFPNLRIVTVPSERVVFRMLENREADVTLRSLAGSAYTIRSEGWFNLRINGQAPQQYQNQLRMGVLKSEPMLRDILNKGIAQSRPRSASRLQTATSTSPWCNRLTTRTRFASQLASFSSLR
jgi:ABC-type amino acid transport substrate-binding protein